jgi:hypothetical protein
MTRDTIGPPSLSTSCLARGTAGTMMLLLAPAPRTATSTQPSACSKP